tara:strand:- start:234 stop:461 length:228 start_codon:yes stop_codon:yes gene_type:complete
LVTQTVVTAVENHQIVGQTTNIDVAMLDATTGFTVLHDSIEGAEEGAESIPVTIADSYGLPPSQAFSCWKQKCKQ